MTRQKPQNQQPPAQNTQLAEIPAKRLIERMAERFGVDDNRLLVTLKATAFKTQGNVEVTNEQMMALMVVADQYGLNPFTKELFAFPDKNNGIVPVVSVDGWARIVNQHPQYDGCEFRYSENVVTVDDDAKECPEWTEIAFYRKDRGHPIVVREYLDEVYRPAFQRTGQNGPYKVTSAWQSHTKRFLRHKTFIQGARIAFGFAGIYDEDEATRIIDARALDGDYTVVRPQGKPVTQAPQRKQPQVIDAEPEQPPEPPAGPGDGDDFVDAYNRAEKGREPGEGG